MTSASSKKPRTPRTRPRRRRLARPRWGLGLAVVFVAVCASAIGLFLQYWRAEASEEPPPGPRRALVWPEGIPVNSDQERALLRGFGFDSDSLLWRPYRATLAADAIAVGAHWLPKDVSGRRALDYLIRNGRRPIHRVVIPEGFDRFEVAERLEAASICQAEAFLAETRDAALLMELKIGADSAEGYLFPDSYDLYENTAAEDVVRLMVRTARKHFAAVAAVESMTAKLAESNWVHATVTLASLVEEEAQRASEQATIAGVFQNRLSDPAFQPARMLQTDPAAAYGCKLYGTTLKSCGGFAGRVTPLMLRDGANPYNTYRHPGLPPGPIANPGEGALRAAMKPAATPYYFFVARGDGSHTFSKTLSEHEQATSTGN